MRGRETQRESGSEDKKNRESEKERQRNTTAIENEKYWALMKLDLATNVTSVIWKKHKILISFSNHPNDQCLHTGKRTGLFGIRLKYQRKWQHLQVDDEFVTLTNCSLPNNLRNISIWNVSFSNALQPNTELYQYLSVCVCSSFASQWVLPFFMWLLIKFVVGMARWLIWCCIHIEHFDAIFDIIADTVHLIVCCI